MSSLSKQKKKKDRKNCPIWYQKYKKKTITRKKNERFITMLWSIMKSELELNKKLITNVTRLDT